MKGVAVLLVSVVLGIFLCAQQGGAECVKTAPFQTYVLQEDTVAVAQCITLQVNSTLDCNFHTIELVSPIGVNISGLGVTVKNCIFTGNSTLSVLYDNIVFNNNVFTAITTNDTAVLWTGGYGQLAANTFKNITCIDGYYKCMVIEIWRAKLIENNTMSDIFGFFTKYFSAAQSGKGMIFRNNEVANITMPDRNANNETHCRDDIQRAAHQYVYVVSVTGGYGSFYNNKVYNIITQSFPDCYNSSYFGTNAMYNYGLYIKLDAGLSSVYDNEVWNISGGRLGRHVYSNAWVGTAIYGMDVFGWPFKETTLSRVYNNYVHDITGHLDAGGTQFGSAYLAASLPPIAGLFIGSFANPLEIYNNTVDNIRASNGASALNAANRKNAGYASNAWGMYVGMSSTVYLYMHDNSITNVFGGIGGDHANVTLLGPTWAGGYASTYGTYLDAYSAKNNATLIVTDNYMANLVPGRYGSNGTIGTSYGIYAIGFWQGSSNGGPVNATFARLTVINATGDFYSAYSIPGTKKSLLKNVCWNVWQGRLGGCCSTDFEVMNSTSTCNGLCEEKRMCDGKSYDCPSNIVYLPSTTVCRVSDTAAGCDKADTCTGSSGDCPETFADSGLQCRASTVCSEASVCNGTSKYCPATVMLPNTTMCREATTVCDLPEYCTGSATTCPSDKSTTNKSIVCRPADGECDVAEYCDGSTKNCGTDKFAATSIVCRSATLPCDETEHCTGTSKTCPKDAKLTSSTMCRDSAGPCDAAEYCDGINNNCPAQKYYDANKICREAAHACDSEERCPGNSPNCPGDIILPDNSTCTVQNSTSAIKCTSGLCWLGECILGTCGAVEGGVCGANGACICSDTSRTFPYCTLQCGDGICDSTETCSSCPTDCGSCCGNGKCDASETCSTCPNDCGSCCGNGICEMSETCVSCSTDCGACTSGGSTQAPSHSESEFSDSAEPIGSGSTTSQSATSKPSTTGTPAAATTGSATVVTTTGTATVTSAPTNAPVVVIVIIKIEVTFVTAPTVDTLELYKKVFAELLGVVPSSLEVSFNKTTSTATGALNVKVTVPSTTPANTASATFTTTVQGALNDTKSSLTSTLKSSGATVQGSVTATVVETVATGSSTTGSAAAPTSQPSQVISAASTTVKTTAVVIAVIVNMMWSL